MYIFDKKRPPVFQQVRKQIKSATEAEDFSSPYDRLAAEIVMGAIRDWRLLINKKAWLDSYESPQCNFEEIRRFFCSQYCEFLMQNFSMTPEGVLMLLEGELQQAMQKDRAKEGKK